MKYSKNSLNQKNNKTFTTPWAFKEGVFETPVKDFIVRIRNKSGFQTISRHKTIEEAKEKYDKINKL